MTLLQQLYKCHRRKVFTIGGWSKWIDGEIGVKQGCVLSPLLFALFINDILEEVKQIGGIEVGNGKISGLLFTDDIVLMGDTEEELRQQIRKIMDYVAKQELEVNLTKSKVMICTNSRKRKGNGENEDIKDKIEGIQETSSYNYLGIHLGNNRPFLPTKSLSQQKYQNILNTFKYRTRLLGNDVNVLDKLWLNVLKPKMLYGQEIIVYDKRLNKWSQYNTKLGA